MTEEDWPINVPEMIANSVLALLNEALFNLDVTGPELSLVGMAIAARLAAMHSMTGDAEPEESWLYQGFAQMIEEIRREQQ